MLSMLQSTCTFNIVFLFSLLPQRYFTYFLRADVTESGNMARSYPWVLLDVVELRNKEIQDIFFHPFSLNYLTIFLSHSNMFNKWKNQWMNEVSEMMWLEVNSIYLMIKQNKCGYDKWNLLIHGFVGYQAFA